MGANQSGCISIAALILAAGAATRMGTLKQLLVYNGRTLLHNAIRQASDAGFAPIIVVVGAQAAEVRAAIAAQSVEIVQNDQWQTGMGSSLAAGIQRLQESAIESYAVAVLLADQPLVNSEHLKSMRRLLIAGDAPIVAAEYKGTAGVPALFKRQLFGRLAALAPDAGARQLLRASDLKVTLFPLEEAAIDIDTPEEFAALSGQSQR